MNRGNAAFLERFATPEERTAYFAALGRRGGEVRRARSRARSRREVWVVWCSHVRRPGGGVESVWSTRLEALVRKANLDADPDRDPYLRYTVGTMATDVAETRCHDSTAH